MAAKLERWATAPGPVPEGINAGGEAVDRDQRAWPAGAKATENDSAIVSRADWGVTGAVDVGRANCRQVQRTLGMGDFEGSPWQRH